MYKNIGCLLLVISIMMGAAFWTKAGASEKKSIGRVINIKDMGAKGDGKTDDTKVIQKALDSLDKGGTVYFPPGEYKVTNTIHVRHNSTTMIGDNMFISVIRYRGTKFINVIELEAHKGIRIKRLGIYGGEYTKGHAKYLIYAKRFHRSSEITDCMLREGIGLIRIDQGYYSRIYNNRMRNVTPKREDTSISHEQWLEVHGPQSAPVYMGVMNTCNLDYNVYTLLGSQSNNAYTRYALRISGNASSMNNNCFECCWKWKSGTREYDSKVGTLIRFDNWIGSMDNMYIEGIHAVKNLFESHGVVPQLSLRNGSIYRVVCDTLFYNAGPNDITVKDTTGWRIMANKLFEVDEVNVPGRTVSFSNCSMMCGERYTDKSISPFAYNLYDTRATDYPLGVKDVVTTRDRMARRMFPKILNGYKVTTGKDKYGVYVQVTCGVFMRADGEFVSMWKCAKGVPTIEPGAGKPTKKTVVVRLRPQEKGKYYRLFVGKAGQVYLNQYDNKPEDPNGNWIAQVQIDEQGKILKPLRNYRLKVKAK